MLRSLLAAAQQALASNDLEQARAIAAQALQAAPNDVNTLHLAGFVAYRSGDFERAMEWLGAAREQAPDSVPILFNLANAKRKAGRLTDAIKCYRATLLHAALHGDAAYNLALCLRETHQLAAAGAAFLMAAQCDPQNLDARQQVLDCATALAREGLAAPQPPPAVRTTGLFDDSKLSIIVCSVDDAKFASFSANLAQRFAGADWELIRIDNATSLCEGYMRGVARSSGALLVFCHDDIELLAPDFLMRLRGHLAQHDVVGVAGSTRAAGPSVFWSGTAHAHSWVVHRDANGQLLPGILGPRGPVVQDAQTLDGVFIAIRRTVLERVAFDAETFDGFHGYDLDFSYRAHRAGLDVAICLDLLLVHESQGDFGESFSQYAERFCQKFPGMPLAAAQPAPFFQAPVESPEAALATYAWLNHWLAGD